MNEWKFARRHGECGGCHKRFEENEAHVSALRMSERDLAREDVCAACWKRAPLEALFWWRTRHASDKKARERMNIEAVEGLFKHLESSIAAGDPTREDTAMMLELRYLLALILVRKRRYRLGRVEREDEREVLELERARTKERTRVWVRDFAPERLAVLGERLQELFDDSRAELVAAPSGGVILDPAQAPPTPSSDAPSQGTSEAAP